MSDTYVERIVKLIAHHRQEIERLETALSVMSQLMESEPVKPRAMAERASSSSITIRRIENGSDEKPKPKAIVKPVKPSADREIKNVLRQKITASLRKNGPQSSGALIAEMFPKGSTKPEKQLIYAALNQWLHKGTVLRRPTGDYELVEQASH